VGAGQKCISSDSGLSFDSASFAFDEMHFRRLQTYRQIEKIHIRYILGMVKVSILQTRAPYMFNGLKRKSLFMIFV